MNALHPKSSALPAATLAALVVFFIGACASTAHVRTAPGTDVSRYDTFAFASPLGTDRAGYSSFLSGSLKSAARSALEAKGYRYSESNPQMLVNFNASAQQEVEVDPMATAPGFYGYRAGLYGGWAGYAPMVDEYDEGTLVIDLVDAAKKELVWEGTTTHRSNDITRWTDDDVQRVVGTIAEQIPAAAP